MHNFDDEMQIEDGMDHDTDEYPEDFMDFGDEPDDIDDDYGMNPYDYMEDQWDD